MNDEGTNKDTKQEYLTAKHIAEEAVDVVKFNRDRLAKAGVPAKHFYNSLRRALAAEDRWKTTSMNASMKEVMKTYRAMHKGLPQCRQNIWEHVMEEALRPDPRSAHPRAEKAAHLASIEVAEVLDDIKKARREIRRRPKFNPVEKYRKEVVEKANDAASYTLTGWKPTVGVKLPNDVNDPEKQTRMYGITVSIGWLRQTKVIGPSIGSRFLASANLVDQIGEYDLYQVEYYEGSDKKLKHGFVGNYRGTVVRGFGHKPETALQWTRRQVLVEAQRKMGVL